MTQRAFYELHCLKERWSVREFQRQRASMLYERVGLSEDRDAVLALTRAGILADSPAAQLRDPYVFRVPRHRAILGHGARTIWSVLWSTISSISCSS